jgi:hypothetical protein
VQVNGNQPLPNLQHSHGAASAFQQTTLTQTMNGPPDATVLPRGWVELTDAATGSSYYFHKETSRVVFSLQEITKESPKKAAVESNFVTPTRNGKESATDLTQDEEEEEGEEEEGDEAPTQDAWMSPSLSFFGVGDATQLEEDDAEELTSGSETEAELDGANLAARRSKRKKNN